MENWFRFFFLVVVVVVVVAAAAAAAVVALLRTFSVSSCSLCHTLEALCFTCAIHSPLAYAAEGCAEGLKLLPKSPSAAAAAADL